MTGQQSPTEWRVMGESVPGASHLRAGVPNQDAIIQMRESGRGLPVVVSISDGHGSDKCFRSDRGSRFAVKEAARTISEFLDHPRGSVHHAEMESSAREHLPREFLRRWREAVESDLRAHPFTEAELDTLERKDGRQALRLVAGNPLLAYGATSLTVAIADSFALYLQLGDGEILTVSGTGEVARVLPEDERLFANETTSLCTPDAERNFRVRVQPFAGERPALILLSTDGYVNSFSDSAGFFKVGSDLLEMLRSDGFDTINASLKDWLEEATRAGSGDDCTLGLVCRMDALCKAEEEPGANRVKVDEALAVEKAKGVGETEGAEVTAPNEAEAQASPMKTDEAGPSSASAPPAATDKQSA